MSVHDEHRRTYTCSRCKQSFREGFEYLHGTGICTPTIADMALAEANKNPSTPLIRRNLALENYIALGKAIQDSGGDAFRVLEQFKPLLEILSSNKISINAKHESTLLQNP